MKEFDSIRFLRSVADHAAQHNLNHTITSVQGYYASFSVSPESCLTESYLITLHRWATTTKASHVSAIVSNGVVHLGLHGKLADGTATEVRTCLHPGVDAEAVLAGVDFTTEQAKFDVDRLLELASAEIAAVA
jgi:hypothetical protein